MKKKIRLTGAEIQSGSNRQKWAEGLIRQLPSSHDGRNSWLLNYGISCEAKLLREEHGIKFINKFAAAETTGECDGAMSVQRYGQRSIR